MLAVTLAAQLMTSPVCIYYFHQFPNLFFITNMLTVPLSTVILFIEIFLVAFSWIPFVGLFAGKLVGMLVWLMNVIIYTCNRIPYALLDNIYATIPTTWLMYVFIIAVCTWLIRQGKTAFYVALTSLICFVGVHTVERFNIQKQKKIIVYNLPQHQAIDFVYRDTYCFVGDSILLNNALLRNFHLKPARISLQAKQLVKGMPFLHYQDGVGTFFNTRFMVIDSSTRFVPLDHKIPVSFLLLSKNPKVKIADLLSAIKPAIVVFDASNSLWKIAGWKKECETVALPCFSIPEKGAFVLDVD